MSKYESEHTKFMREWLQAHPEEVAEQKAGRALWWDKPGRDAETMDREWAETQPQPEQH